MTFATYEKSGRVATVTLNRPESRNAIATQDDCDDLAGALWKANDDPDINAVILTGAGKAFCAGGDLKAIRERSGIGPRATPDGSRSRCPTTASRCSCPGRPCCRRTRDPSS